MSYSSTDLDKSQGLIMTPRVSDLTPKAFPDAKAGSSLSNVYKTGPNSYGDSASLQNSGIRAGSNTAAYSKMQSRSDMGGRPFTDHASSMLGTADQMKNASSSFMPQGRAPTSSELSTSISDPGVTTFGSTPRSSPGYMTSNGQKSGISSFGSDPVGQSAYDRYKQPTGYQKGGLLVTEGNHDMYDLPYYK